MFICNDVIGPKLFIFVNIHNLYVSMKSSSTDDGCEQAGPISTEIHSLKISYGIRIVARARRIIISKVQ